jgi:glycerophosphoryl diester phosphodiesterase
MIVRSRNGSFVEYREISLISHRGGKGFGPENTMQSLGAALEFGVEMVETDVRISADGIPIIRHGPFLGLRLLGRMTIDEIREREPDIPTLQEYLDLAVDKCAINLDIKRCDAAVLAEVIAACDAASPLLVSSFDSDFLEEFGRICRHVELGLLTQYEPGADRMLRDARRCGAKTVLPVSFALNRGLVEAVHEAGIKVITWTVNSTDQLRNAIEAGVDGVITDAYAELGLFIESTVFGSQEEGSEPRQGSMQA